MASTPPRGSRMINGCPELDALLAIEPKVSLGEGTFGKVVLAGEHVIKSMDLNSVLNYALFMREAEAWNVLSNIPELEPFLPKWCYGIIRRSSHMYGTGYLIHKHIPTVSLRTFLTTKQYLPLEPGFSYALCKNLIQAFDLLYKAGYIHRDIKPANILIRDPHYFYEADVAKPLIIDFGIVCKVPCQEFEFSGTKKFSPQNWFPKSERAIYIPFNKTKPKKHVKIDPREIMPFYNKSTDMYSLGIILKAIYDRTEWPKLKVANNSTDSDTKRAIEQRNELQELIQKQFSGVTATHASIRGALVDPSKVIVNNSLKNMYKAQFLENAPERYEREAQMAEHRRSAKALEEALANYNASAHGYNTNNSENASTRKRRPNFENRNASKRPRGVNATRRRRL